MAKLHMTKLGCGRRRSVQTSDSERSSISWEKIGQRSNGGWSVCLEERKNKKRDQTSLPHFHLKHTDGTMLPICKSARSAPFCCDLSQMKMVWG